MKICRQLLYLIFLFSFACATLGMDGSSGPATVLHASGKVQVNGAGSRAVTTLFSVDSVQTDADSMANIIAGGSSILVMSKASAKFLRNMVELTQGGMAIATCTILNTQGGRVFIKIGSRMTRLFGLACTWAMFLRDRIFSFSGNPQISFSTFPNRLVSGLQFINQPVLTLIHENESRLMRISR